MKIRERLAEFEISDNGIGFSVEENKTGATDQEYESSMKYRRYFPNHLRAKPGYVDQAYIPCTLKNTTFMVLSPSLF